MVSFLSVLEFPFRGGVPLHDSRVHPPVSGRGKRRRRALREAHETEVQGARPQQHIPWWERTSHLQSVEVRKYSGFLDIGDCLKNKSFSGQFTKPWFVLSRVISFITTQYQDAQFTKLNVHGTLKSIGT